MVSIGVRRRSVAWVDEVGGLHVGPASAGAAPDQLRTAREAQAQTLADAYLLLGYLGSEPIIGGRHLNEVSPVPHSLILLIELISGMNNSMRASTRS